MTLESVLKVSPSSGFAYLMFSEDGSIEKMLALDNPNVLKSVDFVVNPVVVDRALDTVFF